MNRQAKRVLILITGWSFIALGIVGLFLPILQGVLFILVGLAILSSEYVWAHHLLARLKQRFPRVAHTADEASRRAATWLKRLSGQREPD
jgi:uncharacterized protein